QWCLGAALWSGHQRALIERRGPFLERRPITGDGCAGVVDQPRGADQSGQVETDVPLPDGAAGERGREQHQRALIAADSPDHPSEVPVERAESAPLEQGIDGHGHQLVSGSAKASDSASISLSSGRSKNTPLPGAWLGAMPRTNR